FDFKTVPDVPINATAIGGTQNSSRDKLFVATGSVVKGYNRYGKQFLDFQTNKTEPITSMAICDLEMVLCDSYTLNHFHDCTSANAYTCEERINDVACLPVKWGRPMVIIIACNDYSLRVVHDSMPKYKTMAGGIPYTLLVAGHHEDGNAHHCTFSTLDVL
ncbi:unnamed protein product, partial [Soboliphyme baturini]|uniref:CN hydrolase domain-containing protein n=1 Tax=Soboliphyme baturini TaxID=241478 RepID=A0A183JA95_9BILA